MSGGVKFGLSVVVLAVIWLGVLPWLSKRPAIEAHIERMKSEGIDPSAMFYTEVEEK